MPKLTPENKLVNKQKILKAALICFSESGYHPTSVDLIAQKAEVSKGRIYIYFDSKKSIFLSLLHQLMEATGVDQTTAKSSSAVAILNNVLENLFSFIRSDDYHHFAAILIEAWNLSRNDKKIKQTLRKMYDKTRTALEHLISTAADENQQQLSSAGTLARILLAVLNGLLIQEKISDQPIDWQSVLQVMRSLVHPNQ